MIVIGCSTPAREEAERVSLRIIIIISSPLHLSISHIVYTGVDKWAIEASDIPVDAPTTVLTHESYFDCLLACFLAHRSVVVSPDLLWFEFLARLVYVVRTCKTHASHLYEVH